MILEGTNFVSLCPSVKAAHSQEGEADWPGFGHLSTNLGGGYNLSTPMWKIPMQADILLPK